MDPESYYVSPSELQRLTAGLPLTMRVVRYSTWTGEVRWCEAFPAPVAAIYTGSLATLARARVDVLGLCACSHCLPYGPGCRHLARYIARVPGTGDLLVHARPTSLTPITNATANPTTAATAKKDRKAP